MHFVLSNQVSKHVLSSLPKTVGNDVGTYLVLLLESLPCVLGIRAAGMKTRHYTHIFIK